MSEGDVSSIHDEDVLRRMWQQTEDFGRKKEIRAHMYRLREERLRDLYTQPDQPSQRSDAKGHEFTTSQGHTKSFADQSFQSIKSKEVRDAGSPPREYSYPVKELKDTSNAGWTVESENKTTDDGHTHVKSIHAHVAGEYDVDGGSGRFAAVDRQRRAVTEYRDDNTSLKRDESTAAASAHEQVSRQTEDGGTFSSTISSSSSSSKFKQVSSKQESVSNTGADAVDFSIEELKCGDRDVAQNAKNENTARKTVSQSQNLESSLRSDEGELTSRKVDYPDKNTKVIVETRTLPDGTRVTSTRREIRGPVVQTCHSEQQHSQQTRSENTTSRTTQSHSNFQDTRKEVTHDTSDRSKCNKENTYNKTTDYVDQQRQETQASIAKDFHREPAKQPEGQEFSDEHNNHESKEHQSTNTNENSTNTYFDKVESIEKNSNRKSSVEENHYKTTYKSDYSEKKISSDLSPTHQAWASTLRADTAYSHGSVRGSSPGSRTFHSTTSSTRSSVSPDKLSRKPSSRGGSPTKFERTSPTRTADRYYTTKPNDKKNASDQNIRHASPERTPSKAYAQSPSPTRHSPLKDNYRFIDEETKTSTKFDTHSTNYKHVSDKYSTKNVFSSKSPEQLSRFSQSPSPTRRSPTNDSSSHYTQTTNYDEKRNVDDAFAAKNSNIGHKTVKKSEIRSNERPSKDFDRQPSPSKVSFESDTFETKSKPKTRDIKSDEVTSNTPRTNIHARSPSPTKHENLPLRHPPTFPSNRGSKSPSPGQSPLQPAYREPSPSKYGIYESTKLHSEDVTNITETNKNKTSTTNSVTLRAGSPPKKSPRSSTSPMKHPTKDKYSSTSTDFINSERKREEINRNKTASDHPRQLLTPSSSPTRKPKVIDDALSSTGQSSPTTSVSEIMYFSSPRSYEDMDTVVTDLDDEERFTYDKTEENISITQSENTRIQNNKRSPSPTKKPCKSPKATSPEKDHAGKDNLPRKSSLKKPSSDAFQASPAEKPPTTFQVSPTEENIRFPEHKIVKKDKADKPDATSKLKEHPSFTRSETYEERCRKILGMNEKDSFIEYEKKASNTIEKLPSDIKPTESTKTSSSISPCSSPVRENSPLAGMPSQKKHVLEKKTHDVSNFLSHEKETGEIELHCPRYDSPTRKVSDRSTTPSRESSPTKLLDIMNDAITTKNKQSFKTEKNNSETVSVDIQETQDQVQKHSLRSSISPQRKGDVEFVKTNSKTLSPNRELQKDGSTKENVSAFKVIKNNTDNFISSEKKQEIINRVQKTLKKISPGKDQLEREQIRTPTRGNSPLKKTSQEIRLMNVQDSGIEKMKERSTAEKSINDEINHKQVTNINKTEKVNVKKSSPEVDKTASPIKRPIVQSARTESPHKSRSISPKKAMSGPEKAPQSPQMDRKAICKKPVEFTNFVNQKSFTKKQDLTEFPSQRKPVDKVPIDTRKNSNIKKQNSFTKSSTMKSNIDSKTQAVIINKSVCTKSKFTSKPTQVNSESEDEQLETVLTRRKSLDKNDTNKCNKTTQISKTNPIQKPLVDLKITRASSDISIKTNKSTSSKIKSKPDINVSNISKASTKLNALTTTRTVHQTNKLRSEKPYSNLATKPKSATTLNSTEDDDVIIDIQQAKSSRENSPDKICPTPVSFLEETGKPRLPDEVSEPDDEFNRRTHTTILESESTTGDIIEISEDEEVSLKRISEVDRVTGSDECLLSVTDKVTKFLNKAENLTNIKDKSYNFKETEKDVYSDYLEDKSDECLLSVSQKVNKFAANKDSVKFIPKEPAHSLTFQDANDNSLYEDDYTKLSVNDKAHLFVKTAEEIISPVKSFEPAPKVERPDLNDVHKSLQSDECLLSVSDKVSKFVQSAEMFLDETDDIHKISKTMEHEKYKSDHKDNKVESYAKETVSSHAKVKDSNSPNFKTNERIPVAKTSTLRSSEAVKKAKAMFENIASQQVDQKNEMHAFKATKLTDIGVFKKSTPTDSTIVFHPSLEDGSPNLTDTESDIDVGPYFRNTKENITNRTDDTQIINRFHKTSEKTPDRAARKSPERLYTKSPECVVKVDSNKREDINTRDDSYKREVTKTKSVLSRYPTAQKAETINEVRNDMITKKKVERPSPNLNAPKNQDNTVDDIPVSSRRGSGKFGVELRRTSVEHVTTERRRSSAGEAHSQPCIEDILDLELLEQMLEKVVGYEQRRRIRAQIRVAKKATETTHSVNTNTYTRHSQRKFANEVNSKTKSPDRKPIFKTMNTHDKPTVELLQKHVHLSAVSDIKTRKPSPEKVFTNADKTKSPIRQQSPEKRVRNPSPEKKVWHPSPEKKTRHPSPDKKTRSHSPSKAPGSSQSKSNRFNEYASAYMRKVGLGEQSQSDHSEVNSNKTLTETKSYRNSEFSTVTKTSFEETERRSSKDVSENVQVNGKHTPVSSPKARRRTPSPVKKQQISKDHIHTRTPSPDFKRPRNDSSKTKPDIISTDKANISRFDNEKKVITHRVVAEEKPAWITNNGLRKAVTSETRSFSSKKLETEKPKYRSTSPSKVIAKPTDVITSSYGLGPMDADGKPLFGIKALRNGASNYQVKGTVIRSEYRSTNGSEPEGEVSVTAYSTRPEELARLLEAQVAPGGAVRDALNERARSRHHGLSAITTTKKFGGNTGATIASVHTREEREALQQFSERHTEKKTVRQSSVKSLTEKFIKNAVETTKSEKSSYPKAGLILRTSGGGGGARDLSSGSETGERGLVRSDSEQSLGSSVDGQSQRPAQHGRQEPTRAAPASQGAAVTSVAHSVKRQSTETSSRSFLNSNTKVTGVQDILTRMKNADIVIEDGDTTEDAEARALLNKFLGATVLMAGMESYVTEKPAGRVAARTDLFQEAKSNRTVSSSASGGGGGGGAQLDIDRIWDEQLLRQLLEQCSEYEQRRRIRARLRQVMAEQEACADLVRSVGEAAAEEANEGGEREEVSTTVSASVRRNSSEKTVSSTTTTTSKVTENVSRATAPKSASPFAKFRQLEKQNSTSTPSSPKTPQSPGTPSSPLFKFTDPALQASAGTIKERLLQWCRDKTRHYENVKLLNFSTSWSDGLAFCALIHHFLPDAFDYSQLTADKRRHNFTLAFKIADEKAGIYPLLDVDDMVAMRKPDWKCVFTYVQAIYRRFKDQD